MRGSKSHESHPKIAGPRMGKRQLPAVVQPERLYGRGCERCLGWLNKRLTPLEMYDISSWNENWKQMLTSQLIKMINMINCKQRLGSTPTSGLMPWLASETARSEVEQNNSCCPRAVLDLDGIRARAFGLICGFHDSQLLTFWVNRRVAGLWSITKWTSVRSSSCRGARHPHGHCCWL